MCSSLLGLGGTYVQQCFGCLFPQYLCAAFSCIFFFIQKHFNMSLLSYMSNQHHVGLQPANLVTAQHVLRSRRRSDLSVFFSHYFFFSSRIYTTSSSFHPVFLRLLYTSAADGILQVWAPGEQPPAAELYYDIIFYLAVWSSRASHSGSVAAASLPTAVYSFKASLPPPQLYLFYSAVRSSFFKIYLIANPKMIRTFSIVNQF